MNKKTAALTTLALLFLFLFQVVHAAVVQPSRKARRYMDDKKLKLKAPEKKSKKELELLKKFGKKKPQKPKFSVTPPRVKKRPVPLESPSPKTKAPKKEKKNYTCLTVIIVFLIVLIFLILAGPHLLKKWMEHRRHNF